MAGTIISAAAVTGVARLSSSSEAAAAADVKGSVKVLTGEHLLQAAASAVAYDAVGKGIKLDQKSAKLPPKLHVRTNPGSSCSSSDEVLDISSPTQTRSGIISCCDSPSMSNGRASLDDPHAAAAQLASDLPIYHAVGGSNLSTTFQEGWSHWLGFVQDHPPPYRLTWGLPGQITDDFQPSKLRMQLNMKWTAAKVSMAVFLLK